MDLPYIKKSDNVNILKDKMCISEQEASVIDYEENWKQLRGDFNMQTRCMIQLISRLAMPVITNRCKKVLIECVGENPKDGYIDLLGVYVVQVTIDINSFMNMNSLDKKKETVQLIKRGIEKLSNHVSFDLYPVIEACNKAINLQYINEWYWKKTAKKGRKIARIKIIHDVYEAKIYLEVVEDNKVIIEKLLYSPPPHEYIFQNYLGPIKWISNDELVMDGFNGLKYELTIGE
jgi:hypothetical protein